MLTYFYCFLNIFSYFFLPIFLTDLLSVFINKSSKNLGIKVIVKKTTKETKNAVTPVLLECLDWLTAVELISHYFRNGQKQNSFSSKYDNSWQLKLSECHGNSNACTLTHTHIHIQMDDTWNSSLFVVQLYWHSLRINYKQTLKPMINANF